MIQLDKREIDPVPGEILVFARMRNEALRLPWFLEYHRRLGADRFFIVDNASDDGTTELIASQKDVHHFWTDEKYADNKSGMNWVNELLNRYGKGYWCLTLDADELFVYPYCETRSLKRLGEYVLANNATSVGAHMVDMYADRPITETNYTPGADFLEICRFFDRPNLQDEREGPRRRLFWNENIEIGNARPPVLRKVPFAFWSEETNYRVGVHTLDGAGKASLSGAILHFKFFADFRDRIDRALREKQYWNGSEQYEQYGKGLNQTPGLNAYNQDSIRYTSSVQLVEMGVIHSTPEWDLNSGGVGKK